MAGFGGRGSLGTITIYWYIKICTYMSDHFTFNSGTVHSVPLTEFTAAATCCYSLCFLLLVIPITWRPNKTSFRASTSPTSVSTSTSVKYRFFVFSVLLPLFPTRHNTCIWVCFICRSHSWGHLHWPFMVKKGRVEGGTWSWFSCAHL